MKKSLFVSLLIHIAIIVAAVMFMMAVTVEKEAEPIRIRILPQLLPSPVTEAEPPVPVPEPVVSAPPPKQPPSKAVNTPAPVVKPALPAPLPVLPKETNKPVPPAKTPAEVAAPSEIPAVKEPSVPRESVAPKAAPEPRKPDPKVKEAYLQYLRETIDARKVYPRTAKRLRQSGTVTVRFTVQGDGTLGNVTVVSSCGFDLLDHAASELLVSIAKVRPIPKELGEETIVISLPIEYALR